MDEERMRSEDVFSTVGVNAVSFLPCFDTVDWLTGRNLACKDLCHLSRKVIFWKKWRKETRGIR